MLYSSLKKSIGRLEIQSRQNDQKTKLLAAKKVKYTLSFDRYSKSNRKYRPMADETRFSEQVLQPYTHRMENPNSYSYMTGVKLDKSTVLPLSPATNQSIFAATFNRVDNTNDAASPDLQIREHAELQKLNNLQEFSPTTRNDSSAYGQPNGQIVSMTMQNQLPFKNSFKKVFLQNQEMTFKQA